MTGAGRLVTKKITTAFWPAVRPGAGHQAAGADSVRPWTYSGDVGNELAGEAPCAR